MVNGGCFLFLKTQKAIVIFYRTSNHATRLKANAFRREFATRSQSSPLSAPFGRAGWRCVRVQRGKRQNKRPEAIASGFLFWLPQRACTFLDIEPDDNDTLRLTKLTQASIWHIFLAVFNTPHFASETEKFAVSASLRSAPSVARGCRW